MAFDGNSFARRLRQRLTDLTPLSDAEAAAQAGVSRSTFSRARNGGAGQLSHDNIERLKAWLARGEKETVPA